MTNKQSVLAARIFFLELLMEHVEEAATDAERGLAAHPTDSARGDEVGAYYALAGDTWGDIQDLRTLLSGGPSVIYYDRRLDDRRAQAKRRMLM
jgi:hypothetical protein